MFYFCSCNAHYCSFFKISGYILPFCKCNQLDESGTKIKCAIIKIHNEDIRSNGGATTTINHQLKPVSSFGFGESPI